MLNKPRLYGISFSLLGLVWSALFLLYATNVYVAFFHSFAMGVHFFLICLHVHCLLEEL
jgi:hypothetical protein